MFVLLRKISMSRNILLVCGFFAISASCNKKQELFYANYKPITQSVYASGIVKGINQYQVYAKGNGIVKEIFVTEGDFVKKGGAILKLDNQVMSLAQSNAKATARFNDLGLNQDKLMELQHTVEVLKETSIEDSMLYVRQQNLFQQQVGSKLELEQRTLNYKRSKANYLSSVIKYNQLKRQVDYAAKQANVNAEISDAQLGDLIVKSELDGKIFSILKKKGEMVNSQSPVAVIANSNTYFLELLVDEFDIALIKVGQKVLLSMDSHKGQVFEAKVSKIIPIMNERNKSFLVEADFVKAPDSLYPNLTAEANIVIQNKEKALLIPRNLLVEQQYVILSSGEKRLVQTGLIDYEQVEILSGITTADALVKP